MDWLCEGVMLLLLLSLCELVLFVIGEVTDVLEYRSLAPPSVLAEVYPVWGAPPSVLFEVGAVVVTLVLRLVLV